MSEEIPATPAMLEDFRVRIGVGRVVLMTAGRRDGGLLELVNVAMTPSEARKLADELVARAERVEREQRR